MKAKLLLCGALFAISLVRSPADTLYVSYYCDDKIVEFTPGGVGSLFASSGVSGGPAGVAFDAAGNLFVASRGDNTIWKFPSGGGGGSIFVSSGLDRPQGLAFDAFGNLYVANEIDNTIRKFTPDGSGSVFADEADGLNLPWALAFDATGNLFVGNAANSGTIQKFAADGVGSLFAVGPTLGLAFDAAGCLYASHVSVIRKYASDRSSSLFTSNLLNHAGGLACDSTGDLYVSNRDNSNILKFQPDGSGTVFADFTNGDGPQFIAIRPGLVVPEPSICVLMVGGTALFTMRHRREFSSFRGGLCYLCEQMTPNHAPQACG